MKSQTCVFSKEEARNSIRKILDEQSLDFGKSECTVRINGVGKFFGIELQKLF